MTTLTADRLTLTALAPILRGIVKDKSYRQSELGALVGRYLRWKRNEIGASRRTLDDYELILAYMSVQLADMRPFEVTIEDLREVIDHWGHLTPRTRAKVTSVVRSFWQWAESELLVPTDPSSRLRRPKSPKKVAPLLPVGADVKLLNATDVPRERVALLCLLDLGIRQAGLRGIRVRDFDLARRTLVVTEKGDKSRVLPLRGRIIPEIDNYLLATLPGLTRPPRPDDYLLYPIRKAGFRNQELIPYPEKMPSAQPVHRWWYRMLAQAGLVSPGVTRDMNMHRARHTFATDMRRAADLDAASQALGHSDLSTTAAIYGHHDFTDLERAFETFAKAKRRSR